MTIKKPTNASCGCRVLPFVCALTAILMGCSTHTEPVAPAPAADHGIVVAPRTDARDIAELALAYDLAQRPLDTWATPVDAEHPDADAKHGLIFVKATFPLHEGSYLQVVLSKSTPDTPGRSGVIRRYFFEDDTAKIRLEPGTYRMIDPHVRYGDAEQTVDYGQKGEYAVTDVDAAGLLQVEAGSVLVVNLRLSPSERIKARLGMVPRWPPAPEPIPERTSNEPISGRSIWPVAGKEIAVGARIDYKWRLHGAFTMSNLRSNLIHIVTQEYFGTYPIWKKGTPPVSVSYSQPYTFRIPPGMKEKISQYQQCAYVYASHAKRVPASLKDWKWDPRPEDPIVEICWVGNWAKSCEFAHLNSWEILPPH